MSDPTPAAPDPQHVTVTLTRAECHAINQFMSYGATRGNHSWTPERGEGTGPSPGPLTGCINDMGNATRKIMEAMRLAAAPDQAEGPEENRGDDVHGVTSRAEESVMDKGVFRYDTDKTRLGAPPVPWDPSHREIL